MAEMTLFGKKQTAFQKSKPIRCVIVMSNNFYSFEVGIAFEFFLHPWPIANVPRFNTQLVAERAKVQSGAMAIHVRRDLSLLHQAKLVVVPGWPNRKVPPSPALVQAMQRASKAGAQFLSICSGAFLLAWCGLLHDRTATTHWAYAGDFNALFPNIELKPECLYVESGNCLTSAGSTAGIDACLHYFRRTHGSAMSNAIARRLVAPPHRAGGQRQYIEWNNESPNNNEFALLLEWMESHLHQPLKVRELAKRMAVGERTLARKFQQHLGTTPHAWCTAQRMRLAQSILETTSASIDAVAQKVGYRTTEAFRSVFKREVGTSPMAYRQRFKTG
jgi:AraC family transcriptional regulator, transcriptional activator FtrA